MADPLVEVFGENSSGSDAEGRARTSDRMFVRSQHQLSAFKDGATGYQINAQQALRLATWEKLKRLADASAIPLLKNPDEPYATISGRVKALGLDFDRVASRAGWSKQDIEKFNRRQQIPFLRWMRLAQALALDENTLGIVSGAYADRELGVRLRQMREGDARTFSAATVLGLSEAAWVIHRQIAFSSQLGLSPSERLKRLGFQRDSNFGGPGNRAWKVGYDLATRARQLMGFSSEQPIHALTDIVETQLGIPVVQLELPETFAGATIANGTDRGIAVNLNGWNQDVRVRRMTLAHEMGHLLWDPDNRLQRLVVDTYSYVEGRPPPKDFVEMRANGFAVEFLAPRDAALKVFENALDRRGGLRRVIEHFGISKTAAYRHIENAYQQRGGAISLHREQADLHFDAGGDWEGGEALSSPLFKPMSVPLSRRGRFSGYVIQVFDQGLISKDSVAALLGCGPGEADQAIAFVKRYVLGG